MNYYLILRPIIQNKIYNYIFVENILVLQQFLKHATIASGQIVL